MVMYPSSPTPCSPGSPAASHGLLGLEPKPLSGVLKASNSKEWILSHYPQSPTRIHLCITKGQVAV